MTPHAAKRIIAQAIARAGLPPHRLTARTVSFSDLARDKAVFVTIHGWKPGPLWNDLRSTAHANGFCIEY